MIDSGQSLVRAICVSKGFFCDHGCDENIESVPGIPTVLKTFRTVRKVKEIITASPELFLSDSEAMKSVCRALVAMGTNLLLCPILTPKEKFACATDLARLYLILKLRSIENFDGEACTKYLINRMGKIDSKAKVTKFFAKRNKCNCLQVMQRTFNEDKTCICKKCGVWLEETFICPCKHATYCNKKCQIEDWDDHKRSCCVYSYKTEQKHKSK